MPELDRARVLAVEVELPSGSIAKMLHHEFGTCRSPACIRQTLRDHYAWRGVPRGNPDKLKRGKAR